MSEVDLGRLLEFYRKADNFIGVAEWNQEINVHFPALAAELRALRAEVAKLEAQLSQESLVSQAHKDERDLYRAEARAAETVIADLCGDSTSIPDLIAYQAARQARKEGTK